MGLLFCSCLLFLFCAKLKLNHDRRKGKRSEAKRRESKQKLPKQRLHHSSLITSNINDQRASLNQKSINNMLPASRARSVRATLPANNDNISTAQSAQNGLSSALESLKTLVNDECMCPICLDALTDTRTNPECLHRFCGDCINESLRRCNNECPSCRVHIPTKRTLRKDPQFDNIVSKGRGW